MVAGPIRAVEPNTAATIVYYDLAGNETLDPAEPQNNSSYSHEVLLALYDGLVRMDNAGAPGPGLAESWTRNDDLTEISFKLRHGVTFHDGTRFDAEAVKLNLERNIALGRRAGGTVYEAGALISAIELQGDDGVKLKLKAPNGQIEYWLGSTAGMMISPAALKDGAVGGALQPIGTGPYKLKVFDPNVQTVLIRNDADWGGVAGRPAGFEHHYVPDGRARLNALRSGQANIAQIDARQIPEAKAAGLALQVVEKNALWDIYPNLAKGNLGDLRVRHAMMYAIDREALAEGLTFGSAKATRQLWSSQSPFYVPDLEARYPFDQQKAKALLAEAGVKDGIEITQLLLNNSEYRQLAEALQAMLAEVGIRLKFDVVDVSQFPLFFKQPPRGDVLMARYGGRSDPVQTIFELVGTGGSYAPGGSASPEIDRLLALAKGMAATDKRRVGVMQDLSRAISDTAATIPIITRANVYAYRPGCIMNLEAYLAAGDERFNDVRIAAGCK
ncbi:MAG: peptide/nickel transport system substrate-binding protein [Acetobacteraceae bacterium]|nr:peptide/nickel transport system substrate-binding protein [Acetobacteraceae bacterium]